MSLAVYRLFLSGKKKKKHSLMFDLVLWCWDYDNTVHTCCVKHVNNLNTRVQINQPHTVCVIWFVCERVLLLSLQIIKNQLYSVYHVLCETFGEGLVVTGVCTSRVSLRKPLQVR